MNAEEKLVLSAIYLSQISEKTPSQIACNSTISEERCNETISRLVQMGLIQKDSETLSKLGRNSLKVVLAGGVFDIIHPGHIHTLNEAKKLGDILVVVVATNNTAIKMKKRRPLHSPEQRKEMVDSLSMVDLCLIGHEGDIFVTVGRVMPQVIALGYDQIHQEEFIMNGCKKIGLDARVERLQSPIPDKSSSSIQKEYGEAIHGI